jgi:hypothetical protein
VIFATYSSVFRHETALYMSKAKVIVVMAVSSSGPDFFFQREREYNSSDVNNNGSADSEPRVVRRKKIFEQEKRWKHNNYNMKCRGGNVIPPSLSFYLRRSHGLFEA